MSTPALQTPQTSQPELAKALGVATLFLKREDLHPLGSHKGRSIPHMIDAHLAAISTSDGSASGGKPHFIISSSGNAALAAGLYVKELNKNATAVTLDILVGQNINPKKLLKIQALRDDNISVAIHDRPLQILTVKTHEDPSIKSLRQSVDETALVGYESLARELAEISALEAVFIGTSSGTTAEALAAYFFKNKLSTSGKVVEVHIVQTPSCHPMVEAIEPGETGEKSVADAIVDHVAHRKHALLPLLEKTGGAGWIADNESIKIAQELVQKHANLSMSTNSALSIAGVMNAVYTGRSWTGAVACIIAGE
ncbi:MAG: PLP-dependent lyase/thiolase [bacterium]